MTRFGKTKVRFGLLGAVGVLVTAVPASAQEGYTPYVAEFDGTNGYEFEASESLNVRDGATIEFWIQCDWKTDPGYDPVVLSNIGEEGSLYTVSVLGDRSGISLQSGDYIGTVDYDFSVQRMSHVAIVDFSDSSSAVMVNGSVVGTFNFGFSESRSAGFWIASADGAQSPFVGAIADVRIWDVVLDRRDIVDYSIRDVFDADAPHPEISALIAQSDFQNDTIDLFLDPEDLNTPNP